MKRTTFKFAASPKCLWLSDCFIVFLFRFVTYEMSSKFITLHNGVRMPTLGYGTWLSNGDPLRTGLKKALDVGYRHVDTAYLYGNEDIVGDVLKQWFASGSGKREDVFITTKLSAKYHRRLDVERSLKESLEMLQLDYVDLFLIHTPMGNKCSDERTMDIVNERCVPDPVDHLETWKGMEDVLNKGLTRAIGLSNFSIPQMQRILDNCSVKPHNIQVECHLYWPQFELHDFCKKHNISFTAYAPLGSPGRLTHPLTIIGMDVSKQSDPLNDTLVKDIAAKHGKSSGQVLLKWLLQRDMIVIPKSTSPAHILENFQLFDFELSSEEMKMLNERTTLFMLRFSGLKIIRTSHLNNNRRPFIYKMSSKCVTLHNGVLMPMLGYGTWLAEGELLYNGLKKALDVGYRHIDTAYVYENEDIIGDVLKQWFDSGSGKREDIFITTKLSPNYHQRPDVERSLKESLERLKLNHVDLFLIHTPVGSKRSDGRITEAADRVDPLETWKGMEDVLNKGLTRAIGLSNFSVSQTQRILDRCSVKPHNVQVECHIYWPQFELHGFCKEQNISFTAYTSLGNPGRHARLRARIGANVTKLEEPLNDTTVKDIAAKHGKSPAQILLKWVLQRDMIVIPKTSAETIHSQALETIDVKYIALQRIASLRSIASSRQRFCVPPPPTILLLSCFATMSSKCVTLHNGLPMPMVGYGTWQGEGDALRAGLKKALEVGYRLIDTAYIYENEDVIGEVLQQWLASGSGKREDLFVTTKLPMHNHRRPDVQRSLKESLERLKLDYVDLFLVHTPVSSKQLTLLFQSSNGRRIDLVNDHCIPDDVDHLETWKGMEDVLSEGLTRSIGLSNFNIAQMVRIMDNCTVKPHNLQVECHLYWPQFELHEFCKRHNISFTAYGPIGSPGRRNHPMARIGVDVSLVPVVLMKWLLQRDIIVIPKSTNPSHIASNFQLFDFELNDAEMKALNEVQIRERIFPFYWYEQISLYVYSHCVSLFIHTISNAHVGQSIKIRETGLPKLVHFSSNFASLLQWTCQGPSGLIVRSEICAAVLASYAMPSKCVTLHNGLPMPMVGYGTWLGKDDALRIGLRKALEVGYRHIDTAYVYENEDVIGEVLQQWFASGSGKREDLFVTTKLPMHNHRRPDVQRSLKESLERLKLDYVDLFLVHTPLSAKASDGRRMDLVNDHCIPDNVDHLETWKGMEDVLNEGLTRSIGLSNFNIAQMVRIMDSCTVKPHNLQVECHLYWPQFELYEFCKRHNISFTAYSPIGSPGRRGSPLARIGVDISKQHEPLDDPLAKQIATKHGKSTSQAGHYSSIVRITMCWRKTIQIIHLNNNTYQHVGILRAVSFVTIMVVSSGRINASAFLLPFCFFAAVALPATYAMSSKCVTLHNGLRMPMVGYGTWQGKGDALRAGLRKALEVGYRLIDTAYVYENEDVIGEVLQQWLASGSGKREDLFVTTKLAMHRHRRADVERSLRESLERFKLDYVDLFLVHAPLSAKSSDGRAIDMVNDHCIPDVVDHLETWKGMEDVLSKGLTRSIGLSNFNIAQMTRIMDNCTVKPHNVQVQLCQLFSTLQPTRQSRTSQSPGVAHRGGRFVSASDEKVKQEILMFHSLRKQRQPMDDPLAKQIATKHGKSVAQVLLKWLVQRGIVVIPMSTIASQIVSNLQLFDFTFDDAEMKALNAGEEPSTLSVLALIRAMLLPFCFYSALLISYAVSSKYVTLHNGVLMPMVGYGTWQAHGDALRSGLRKALEVGYRHIDTAYIYQNEDVIGEVLQQWFASGSGKREDVFVTTKLPWHSRRRDDVERSLKESLARLKLDYVDLYLVHTPQRGAGMEDVFSKGLARSIGLSNFNIDQIVSIMDNSKVKPHNLQVECHLYWPQFELLEFCKRHNISFTAYSPLGSPGRRSRLPSEHKPLEDPLAGEIATKHGKSAAQAGIIKIVNALLSVSTTPSYIISNFELSDFELTGAEMKALNEVKIREQFFRQRSVHVTHLKDGTISKPAFLKHWALSRLRVILA
ncbi:hypothetical protein M514_01386 [Trichuris suis]|uniref:NADP-dependent oxidoreductase domain-containing protein n=1 Tax=Trichuris suis TaxID=68888 RepID=A0A085NRV4_9BILA|nr:hypothetical protein M514_01386 [Trichuris suis]